MNYGIQVRVFAGAYLTGIPLLVVGVLGASHTAISIAAGVLATGWLALMGATLQSAVERLKKE